MPKNKIFFLLLFFIALKLSAQPPQLKFKHYSTNDGLSQNTVYSILQDKNDFIWIGTEDGLNRFDAYDFTIYKQENGNNYSLSNSKINALLQDKNGSLWIATANGLNRYDKKKDQFDRIKFHGGKSGELDLFVTSMLEDSRNNLWVGTLGSLSLYNRKSGNIQHFYNNQTAKFADLNKVRTIFEDRSKILWISIGNDLKRFDPVKKIFMPLPTVLENNKRLREGTVRVIKQDGKGNFWFGTELNGLFYFNPSTGEFINYLKSPINNSVAGNVIRDLFFKNDNELWIGTRDGLSILNINTRQFSTQKYDRYDPHTLSHNSVRHIIQDNSGNIWLGTFSGGLNIYSPLNNNFSNIGEQIGRNPGLNFPVVGAIVTNLDGSIWVGTEGGGLNYINRKKGIYRDNYIQGQHHSIIKSLLMDANDKLWLGTYDGLAILDINTGVLKDVDLKRANILANNQVFALAKNNKGLWIGTDGAGLTLLNNNQVIKNYLKQTDEKSISGNTIFSLLANGTGELWIGTDKGLNFLTKSGNFKHYSHSEGNFFTINHNAVSSLFKDSRGILWIGTKGGGLNVFNEKDEKFYAITVKNGLSNDIVHGIREDRLGNIWISTNKGISKIAFKNFAFPLRADMYKVMNYSIADGLQNDQFSANAVANSIDGELLFGGISGISAFYPEKILQNTHPPKVVITELLIKNKVSSRFSEDTPLSEPISETKKITLTNDQAFFTLKFTALNFINPNKNRYAYKLEGFKDNDWHYVDLQRSATFTNLDAGKYIFMVKAANNDGIWNEVPTKLEITVLPPWFKSWWAFFGYAVVFSLLLYLYYSYSLKTAALRNELILESRIRENEQELFQRKLNFFTNISHEIKTPLTLILSPLEKLLDINSGNNRLQNQLMLMKRNGEHLIRLLNQLLDFRKFESGNINLQAAEGNIVRFIREVVFTFDGYAHHLNIKISVQSSQKSIRVWFDRDKFEKIMYNLISNALKFTKSGGVIKINISETPSLSGNLNDVVITVEDNGFGIPTDNIEKIFDQFKHYSKDGNNKYGSGIGLAYTKGLVELHHGKIEVNSLEAQNDEAGFTCFKIRLPMDKHHLKPAEIISDYKDSENIEAYGLEEDDIDVQIQAEDLKPSKKFITEDTPVMLIVEDNQDVLHFLVSHFEEEFVVHQANNGAEGVNKAIALIPDIIISDVMMPEMSGTVMCGNLKKDNRTSHIPIILLTARTPLIYKIEGLDTGADDYITKPFSLKFVEARVRNLLMCRHQLRERYRREVTLQPSNLAITLPDEIFLNKVMAYIETNLTEPTLNVEDLGKEVFMSRVTLYRKIKALTNQTTIEFIRSVRLKKALQFLQTENYSVSEVGYMVGFTDTDYFRKCFKEQFGKTPKEFIRKPK